MARWAEGLDSRRAVLSCACCAKVLGLSKGRWARPFPCSLKSHWSLYSRKERLPNGQEPVKGMWGVWGCRLDGGAKKPRLACDWLIVEALTCFVQQAGQCLEMRSKFKQ